MLSLTMVSMAGWLLAAAASLPADDAENQRVAPPAGGQVAPGPDGSVAMSALLAALREDAARRTRQDPGHLALQAPEAVTWSDGSLGCAQPGLAYTQALVPGWRVRVDLVGGGTLIYHASRRGQWLLCPAGRAGGGARVPVTR